MIQLVIERLQIPVQVIIRPRRGDFLYTESEFEVMRRDIEMAKSAGAEGVVFGILQADGSIDTEHTRGQIAAARPLSVTIHRAFDMCRDPLEALDELIALGVDRLLTSGQEATAEAGIGLIRDLVERATGRIAIMPARASTQAISTASRKRPAQLSFTFRRGKPSTVRCTIGIRVYPWAMRMKNMKGVTLQRSGFGGFWLSWLRDI